MGDSDKQGVIRNIGFENIYVSGANTVGVIAGMHWGTMERVWATGEVHASAHSVGGLAGRTPADGSGTVDQPDPAVAAIPTIKDSWSAVRVVEEGNGDSTGGIIGRAISDRTIVENTFASGLIQGYKRTGGIVGDLRVGADVINSVAANPMVLSVEDSDYGKAIGRIQADTTVEGIDSFDKMYFTGKQTSELNNGKPRTAQELASKETYFALGWDFDTVWEMRTDDQGRSYPALQGQNSPYPFDFESFVSSISFTTNFENIKSNELTITITDLVDTKADGSKVDSIYVVASDTMPNAPQDSDWVKGSSATIDGLEPSTKYNFWIKVKTDKGSVSGWNIVSQNTSYKVSYDATPMMITVTPAADPSTAASVNWAVDNIELSNPVVLIRKAGDRRFTEYSNGKNTVKEITLTENELFIDAIRNYMNVSVEGLTANTKYEYKVGDKLSGVYSEVRSFSTMPNKDEKFTFILTTDPQVQYDSRGLYSNMKTVEEKYPESILLVNAGDVTEKGYAENHMATYFAGADQSLSKRMFMNATGNHDRDNYLSLHFNPPTQILDNVYSLNIGNVHIAVLNTEYYEGEKLQQQIDWLKKDMAKSEAHWNMILLHKAFYSATDHVDDADIDTLRKNLIPVVEELGIDVVLQGHDHSFGRGFIKSGYNSNEKPGVDEKGRELFKNPQAPLYFINGTAGNSKWYQKIQYDHNLLNFVSPEYEFIDKASSTYESVIKEQSFTAITVDGENITMDTWFSDYPRDDQSQYSVEPYLFDSIALSKDKVVKPEPIMAKGYTPGEMNLRAKVNGEVIGTIPALTLLEGQVDPSNSRWLKVTYKEQEGYVFLPLLADNLVKGYLVGQVNQRETPNGKIVGSIDKGRLVEGVSYNESKNWVYANVDGKYVYI